VTNQSLAVRGVISVIVEELAADEVGAASTAGRRRRAVAKMVGVYIL